MKNLSRAALFAGLSTVLVYFSSVTPTGKLAVLAVSGFVCAVVLIHCGYSWSLGVFAVSAALSLLIVPIKACGVLYAVFFGWYPVVKSLFEKIHSAFMPLICKIAVFNVVATILLFAFRELVFSEIPFPELGIVVLYVIGNVAFVLYDICLTIVIGQYIRQISKHIK